MFNNKPIFCHSRIRRVKYTLLSACGGATMPRAVRIAGHAVLGWGAEFNVGRRLAVHRRASLTSVRSVGMSPRAGRLHCNCVDTQFVSTRATECRHNLIVVRDVVVAFDQTMTTMMMMMFIERRACAVIATNRTRSNPSRDSLNRIASATIT